MEILSILVWLVIGTISGIYLFYKKKFTYWKDRGVPYVEPTIPIGNLPLKKKIHFKDITGSVYKHKDGSPFLGAFIFAQPVVVATDLDFVQSVLIKDFSSFHGRGAYVNEEDDPLAAHMFSLDGEKWKSLRTKLSPTFTSGKMKFMLPTVVEVAERFNEILAERVRPSAILEIKDYLARFTTDVIGTCAFGIECNSLKCPDSEFRRYGQKAFDEMPVGPLIQLFAVQYPNLARKLHIKFFTNDVTKFFVDTVRQTIDFREKNNVRRNDFMDLLIKLKNNESIDGGKSGILEGMTLEEVAAQAFLFFGAGFETSSTTMMFALYELALNPLYQERARQDINEMLAKHDGRLSYESIQEMTYVDQIISETIRKYPPVVHLIRQCTKNYPVPNTKTVIEKGTTILIPAYAIHHDPDIYPSPEIFDPERFSPEQIKSRHPQAFQGFGDGPRNCIGLRFGKMQSKIGLITLLKNYQFKTCAQTSIPMEFLENSIILAPKYGMHLKVEKI